MLTKRQSFSRSSFTDDDSDVDENLFVIKKNTTRKKSYRKWTKEEDERLKEFINSNGGLKDWSKVSQYVGNGRTDAQCQHRWERFLDPSITKGPWTDEEDRKVIELVRDYGARQWSLIAKELKGRVGKQCRERWHNHLNPAINKNPWTNDENILLFILHQHFGNKWAEIARYFNGRSDNSIKNHWNSSMKKKFETEVANLKNQGLDWMTLVPPDFSWPKIDKPSSSTTTTTTTATRQPLSSITNRLPNSNIKRSLKDRISIKSTTNTENPVSIVNSDNTITTNHYHFYSSNENNLNSSTSYHLNNIYPDSLQRIITSETTSDIQQERSSQDYERLFYCTPPSPVKQLPMLSSCADYTSSSQNSQTNHHMSLFNSSLDYYVSSQPSSIPIFPNSTSPIHLTISSLDTTNHRNMFMVDDSFSLNFNSQNDIKQDNEQLLLDLTHSEPHHDIIISPKAVSNASSPYKNRVLNTPERLDQPHRIHLTDHDWLNDFLTHAEQMPTTINDNNLSVRRNKRSNKHQTTSNETKRRESFSRNLFNSSKKLKEELGYCPTYTEILIGQTRDQRYVTEQARRYLSCSSLNISN